METWGFSPWENLKNQIEELEVAWRKEVCIRQRQIQSGLSIGQVPPSMISAGKAGWAFPGIQLN